MLNNKRNLKKVTKLKVNNQKTSKRPLIYPNLRRSLKRRLNKLIAMKIYMKMIQLRSKKKTSQRFNTPKMKPIKTQKTSKRKIKMSQNLTSLKKSLNLTSLKK